MPASHRAARMQADAFEQLSSPSAPRNGEKTMCVLVTYYVLPKPPPEPIRILNIGTSYTLGGLKVIFEVKELAVTALHRQR